MDQDRLKELFSYDPLVGKLIRLKTTSPNAKAGDEAGWVTEHNYKRVSIDGKSYYVHRLAWLYTYGVMPKIIDHDDRDTLNNKLKNLNNGSVSDNMKNTTMPKTNTTGHVGVRYFKKHNTYGAYIKTKGVQNYLGTFKTMIEAIKARKDAEIKYKFHVNHGSK